MGERSTEHRSTQLHFTTLLRSMQQELQPSILTWIYPLNNLLAMTLLLMARDSNVATTRLSITSSKWPAAYLKNLDLLNRTGFDLGDLDLGHFQIGS